MDQRNYGFQRINFNPNEMYPRDENQNNFMQRKFCNTNNSTSSSSPMMAYRQMVFQPPYSNNHVVENNINTHESSQRQQRSPFFINNEIDNGSRFDNRCNSFQPSRGVVYNQKMNNNPSIYKPKPFINANSNPYGSINSFHSYALNNMSTVTSPNEPDIQVIDLEQFESNANNNFNSKNFNQKQQIQMTIDPQFNHSNEISKNDSIIESTEKLQIENKENLPKKPILKRKFFDSTMADEDLNEPDIKRQRVQTMRVLTGNIEKIIHWHKILPNYVFCLFETIGPCIKVNNGFNKFEKRFLLRDERGPVLQVSFYETDIPFDEEQIQLGKLIHCIGRMVSANRLIALKISEIKSDKSNIQAYLSRIAFKLENTVNRITYQSN